MLALLCDVYMLDQCVRQWSVMGSVNGQQTSNQTARSMCSASGRDYVLVFVVWMSGSSRIYHAVHRHRIRAHLKAKDSSEADFRDSLHIISD